MATFPSAAGYGQFPNGNWSSIVFEKKTQDYFKTVNLAEMVTNNMYEGEIKGKGTAVRILKAPVITVNDYTTGQNLSIQNLSDDQLEMLVDQAKYYAFSREDIERDLGHTDIFEKTAKNAAYELKKAFDQNVFSYMYSNANTETDLGTNGSPINIGFGTSNSFTPANFLARAARKLNENDIPLEDRYCVAPPIFWETMAKEDSKLVDVSVTGDDKSILRSQNFAVNRPIHGFTCFTSNNLPLSAGGYYTVLIGHREAVATATAIMESEVMRRESTFGDLYRGLLVFGRKVLRPEALFSATISSFTDA